MSLHGNVVKLFCLVIPLVAAAVVWGCRTEIVDVNGCGGYPPPGTCVLINWKDDDRGCCNLCMEQHVKKEWYDCDGDGMADCEYDLWFADMDSDCCPDWLLVGAS